MRSLYALFVAIAFVSCGGGSPSDGLYGSGGGAACSAEVACSDGFCDPTSNTCVGCLFSSQCGASQICKEGSCVDQPSCSTSLDCAKNEDGLGICDPVHRVCVECNAAEDCGSAGECVSQRCVSHTACTDSRDCDGASVCDPAKGWCVECVSNADCPEENVCLNSECRPSCTSDNQCTPQGQLCDKQLGVCADCLTHDQCPAEYYCSLGKCEFDVCEAGATSCEGGAIVTCNDVGDAFSAPTACGAAQTCSSSGGAASCVDWTCEAGTTYCEPGTETAIACSPDGLSVLARTDCAATGQKCFAGECRDQLCTPGSRFCDSNALKECDGTGQSAAIVTQCGNDQYCDSGSNACVAQICAPSAAVCNGSVATTCNAQGSGYVAGGTDCATLGQTCAGGACTSCPSPNTLRGSMRIVEVHYGDPDYAVLKNQHPTCPANLNGLGVRLAYVDRVCSIGCYDVVKSYNAVLTNQEVPAGGSVYITEKALSSADIAITSQLDWGGNESGSVRLCDDLCDANDGSNTYDAVLVANASTQVTLPAPVTFSGPISGVNAQNQFYTSYVRSAFNGAYPTFQGSDWTTGPASRPSQ